jgi:hypothetical protein
VQRVVARRLLDRTRLQADEGHGGAVAVIQRFVLAVNPSIHLRCLVLNGMCRCDADEDRSSLTGTHRRIRWARRLTRGFDIDMRYCPNYGAGDLKIIAAILGWAVMHNEKCNIACVSLHQRLPAEPASSHCGGLPMVAEISMPVPPFAVPSSPVKARARSRRCRCR